MVVWVLKDVGYFAGYDSYELIKVYTNLTKAQKDFSQALQEIITTFKSELNASDIIKEIKITSDRSYYIAYQDGAYDSWHIELSLEKQDTID